MTALWAVYVHGAGGRTELEAAACRDGGDGYELARRLGYGLEQVVMCPRIADWETVHTRAKEGWQLEPLAAWWDTYVAAREGRKLPGRWPPFPDWAYQEGYEPKSPGLTDRDQGADFDWSAFEHGDRVVAVRGEPRFGAAGAALSCVVCEIPPSMLEADAGLETRPLRYGWEIVCNVCWRRHWATLRTVGAPDDLPGVVESIVEDDPRLWWEWDWDDEIFVGDEAGRHKWRVWYRLGYSRSVAWRWQRERLRRRAGDRCEWCGEPKSRVGWLEGHHLSYKDVGHEDLDDLVLLCWGCHDAAHGEKEPPAPKTSSEHAQRYYQLGRWRVAQRQRRPA